MQLMILILNREEYLEEIMEAFVEVGVTGATIIDSVGMGRILSHDIPIFAGFRNLMQESRPGNKTILSVIDDGKTELIIKAVEQICGPFSERGKGVLLTVPLGTVHGIPGV
jgi:nitrogen regulatory protein P-II 1